MSKKTYKGFHSIDWIGLFLSYNPSSTSEKKYSKPVLIKLWVAEILSHEDLANNGTITPAKMHILVLFFTEKY